jgi:hypothetical protein
VVQANGRVPTHDRDFPSHDPGRAARILSSTLDATATPWSRIGSDVRRGEWKRRT